jgi:hypothetical protein
MRALQGGRDEAFSRRRRRGAGWHPASRNREERGSVMFVVERRLPNPSTADLAVLQEALLFVCDRAHLAG